MWRMVALVVVVVVKVVLVVIVIGLVVVVTAHIVFDATKMTKRHKSVKDIGHEGPC